MAKVYKFIFIILLSFSAAAQNTTPTITVPESTVCVDASLTFSSLPINSTSLSVLSYSWSVFPATSVTILSDLISPVFSAQFSASGRYTVKLMWNLTPIDTIEPVTTFTTSKTIVVNKYAKASFNASLTNEGFPNQLSLTNYSSNSINHYWIFDNDFTTKDSSETLTKGYASSGTFSVMLISIGSGGCNDTAQYDFRISDSSSVVLPNIFTPNYDDANDTYKPITRGIAQLNVKIYDRYGVILTSWTRLNGFWDGHTTSGLECSVGQYFVIVEATGFDGKKFKLKKTITLLR